MQAEIKQLAQGHTTKKKKTKKLKLHSQNLYLGSVSNQCG